MVAVLGLRYIRVDQDFLKLDTYFKLQNPAAQSRNFRGVPSVFLAFFRFAEEVFNVWSRRLIHTGLAIPAAHADGILDTSRYADQVCF